MYSSTSFCFIRWCSHVTGNFHWRGVLWNVDASTSCIRCQCSVALLMDHIPWLWYVRRRTTCRFACNVCGVTTVNGSSVGSSSCCRLSTRCSLSDLSKSSRYSRCPCIPLDTTRVLSGLPPAYLCISLCWPQAPVYNISPHLFAQERCCVSTATRYHTD